MLCGIQSFMIMSWTQKQIYFRPHKEKVHMNKTSLHFLNFVNFIRFTVWFSSQCAQSTPSRPERFPKTSTRRSLSGSPCTPPASSGSPSSRSTSAPATLMRYSTKCAPTTLLGFAALPFPTADMHGPTAMQRIAENAFNLLQTLPERPPQQTSFILRFRRLL